MYPSSLDKLVVCNCVQHRNSNEESKIDRRGIGYELLYIWQDSSVDELKGILLHGYLESDTRVSESNIVEKRVIPVEKAPCMHEPVCL